MSNRREFIRQMALAGTGTATGIFAANAMSSPALAQTAGAGFATLIAASDAPQSIKDQADFVCSGSNDHVTINNALAALIPTRNSGLGGVVQLSPGTFYCSGSVRMRPRTALVGSGRATILKATRGWDSRYENGVWGGVIETNTEGVDKVHIAFLTIDGNRKNVHGVYFYLTEKWFDDGSPDAANHLTDLYVYRPNGDGIHLTGSRTRAHYLSRVRVWNADGHGYYLDAPDSFYSQCETGSSGKSGFIITKSNSRFTNCKAWYSDGNGFDILGGRNQFSACESQDNEGHGYYIKAVQVTLTSCHADSNNWHPENPSASNSTENRKNSGFCIEKYWGFVQLIGCQAYDKNEGGRGHHQKYGFYLMGKNDYCQITGLCRDNANGLVLQEGSQGIDTSVDVIGR